MRHAWIVPVLAALAIVPGCSRYEAPVPSGSVTLTTSLNLSPQTKALSSAGNKVFEVDEKIAVVYQNTGGSTVKAESQALQAGDIKREGKCAEFTVSLLNPDNTQPVTYIYPAAMAKADGSVNDEALSSQDGTLETLSQKLDFCSYTGSWSGSSLPTNVTLENQFAICKFTITNVSGTDITSSITGLTLHDGTNIYSVTPSSLSTIWVAMQPVTSEMGLDIRATDASGSYHKSLKGQTLAAGHIVPVTASLPKVIPAPTGAIDGLFTVSAEKQVYFSMGNLQHQASSGTWRFAEAQSDFLGSANAAISSSNSGWIDLFGWGTSGFNHGATAFQPWSASTSDEDYYVYADSNSNLFDGTGDKQGKADWGCNAVRNGGNAQNAGWRTLKTEEWNYLLNERSAATRFAKAFLFGTVHGVILFPDGYIHPDGIAAPAGVNGTGSTSWDGNQYNTSEWAVMQAAGAVFLPLTGYRSGTSVLQEDYYGYYWSGTHSGSTDAYLFYFEKNAFYSQSARPRNNGCAVRLVKNAF